MILKEKTQIDIKYNAWYPVSTFNINTCGELVLCRERNGDMFTGKTLNDFDEYDQNVTHFMIVTDPTEGNDDENT